MAKKLTEKQREARNAQARKRRADRKTENTNLRRLQEPVVHEVADQRPPDVVEASTFVVPKARPRPSKKVPSPHLAKPCPKCGAEPGKPCVSAKPPAYDVATVHKAREA